MNKEIVTYPIAKALKELGFREKCLYAYLVNNENDTEMFDSEYMEVYGAIENTMEENVGYLDWFEYDRDLLREDNGPWFDYNISISELKSKYDDHYYGQDIEKRTWLYYGEEESMNQEEYENYLSDHQDGDWEPELFLEIISAPFWQQVIEWLREKHNCIINLRIWSTRTFVDFKSMKTRYQYNIYINNDDPTVFISSKEGFTDSYNELREKAILKAIELISNKK